jgi:hypothetical protein
MLKPADQPVPGPDEERPVGDLVHKLVEDGKAYAKAELDLAKVIATANGKALAVPAALIGAALLFAIAAIGALATGVVLALAEVMNPLLAGLITLLLFGAIAGGLGYLAAAKARSAL